MTIKEFVIAALDGGYLKSPYENSIREFSQKGFWVTYYMPSMNGQGVFPSDSYYPYHEMFLNAEAWRSVGKTLSWGSSNICPVCEDAYDDGFVMDWQKYMTKMISALILGKTLEEYIATL